MRGIWLTNVDSQVFNSPSNIAEAIAFIAETGFDTVFPVIWNKGYTLYPSQVMSETFGKAWEIAPLYQQQRWNPLEEIIKAAQVYNLKVIPWFEYGFVYTHNSLQNPTRFALETQLAKKNWLAIDKQGKLLIKNGFCWLNALSSEVQEFMQQIILEVVQTYPVAGIQGDDRLPAFPIEGGYDTSTKQLYQQQTGKSLPTQDKSPVWMQWRADILTNFLSHLYQNIKKINPQLIVSIAPHPPEFGYREYLQDIPQWLKLGIVDYLHPQLYRRTFNDYQKLLKQTITQLDKSLLPKLSPGILIKIGSYRIPSTMLKQVIDYHRRLGIQGEVCFFYEGIKENHHELAQVLREYYHNSISFQ